MYPNLEAELKRKNIRRADLARFLACTIATVSEKMQGKSDFSLTAAKKIKAWLNVDMPLEILFDDDKPSQQPA